jgi:serine/threonine-protein kinase
VLKGSTVTLVASKGRPFVTVPGVTGRSYDEAKRELEAAGLVASRAIDIPGGNNRVINQTPSAGSKIRKGSTVTLYVF